jgi:hypothetical protein
MIKSKAQASKTEREEAKRKKGSSSTRQLNKLHRYPQSFFQQLLNSRHLQGLRPNFQRSYTCNILFWAAKQPQRVTTEA